MKIGDLEVTLAAENVCIGLVLARGCDPNAPLTLDFWHGHNGQLHRFTLLPEHFADLKAKKRVTLETSIVDGHQHKMFIDPVDPRYRVANAPPIEVPV